MSSIGRSNDNSSTQRQNEDGGFSWHATAGTGEQERRVCAKLLQLPILVNNINEIGFRLSIAVSFEELSPLVQPHCIAH